MSTVMALARTNYVHVTDVGDFTTALDRTFPDSDLRVVTDNAGRVAVIEQSGSGWPPPHQHEGEGPVCDECGAEQDQPAPMVREVIAAHLAPGQVAVLIEVGFEGTRSRFGLAQAVNGRGQVVQVDLDDIYEQAGPLGDGTHITAAEC